MKTAEYKGVDSVTGTAQSLGKDKTYISLVCVKRWGMSKKYQDKLQDSMPCNCGFSGENTSHPKGPTLRGKQL